MYLDKENLFSFEQAVTATAAAPSVVDLGRGDAGPSERISLFVNAEPAFTGGGALVVELRTADTVSEAGALVSPVTVAQYPVTAAQLLEGGKLVSARLPHGMQRYAGLQYTVSGSLAAGKLTAGLVLDSQAER